jgi:cytochrome bd-type quinol oxidase subunit 1
MFGMHSTWREFRLYRSFNLAITIGLASYLAVLEGLWLKTKNPVWRSLYHFWSKIFAVNFGMGVVSGLVMAYQFGTNWSGFSEFAGSITGPLLTYEVLTAFFQAGFLGGSLAGTASVWHALFRLISRSSSRQTRAVALRTIGPYASWAAAAER